MGYCVLQNFTKYIMQNQEKMDNSNKCYTIVYICIHIYGKLYQDIIYIYHVCRSILRDTIMLK